MRKKVADTSLKAESKAAVWASIAFAPDLYETPEEIAQQRRVSLVRDTLGKYVAEQEPLLTCVRFELHAVVLTHC